MAYTWGAPTAPDFNYSDAGGAPVMVRCSKTSPEGTEVTALISISLTAVDDGNPLPTDGEFTGWQAELLDALAGAGWALISATQTTSVKRTALPG
jgi:hypothetical protein